VLNPNRATAARVGIALGALLGSERYTAISATSGGAAGIVMVAPALGSGGEASTGEESAHAAMDATTASKQGKRMAE
jgi:hypothetical protein